MSKFRRSLGTLAKSAGGDVGRFRDLVERWYDDQMERVSGRYGRRVSAITLVIAVLLVLSFNINVVTLGRALYGDAIVQAAVSTAAANGTSCPAGQEQQACLAGLEGRLSSTVVAGLPIGWGTIPGCEAANARCNWLDKRGILSSHGDSGWPLTLILIGFLVTIAALILGARLWFRILTRFGSLRATGPKPATSANPRQSRSGTEARMAQRPSTAQRFNYSRWPVVAVVAFTAGTLALAAYAIRAGVQHLASGHSTKDAASSLWHLVILSVAAGILSYAVVEFVKRQTRMRRLFNARIVKSRFGSVLSFPQSLGGGPDSAGTNGLPLETEIAVRDPISYSGSIQQVTAQISLQLRQLVRLATDRSLPEELKRNALTLALGLDHTFSGTLPDPEGERRSDQIATIQDLVDRRLDIFQIEATQRWCFWMRTLGAVTAGLLAAISAWAVTSSLTAILVAALFGIFVGGPMSWITRDLTRVVERRALF